jgi:branched-chain amino acid transport system permease protein
MNTIRKLLTKHIILIAVILVLVAIAIYPSFKPPIFYLSLLFSIFMYITLCQGWNILGGYAGYQSFGHIAFFGIGAYVSAVLLRYFGLSPFLTCFLGGLLSAGIAGIIGYPVLRLRGPYFGITTFLFALVLQVVAVNWDWIGGSSGIWLKSMETDIRTNREIFYEVMFVAALVTTLVAIWVEKSKFGLALSCIREDEDVAGSLGINAPLIKVKAFMLSVFFVGVVGGIYAYYVSYIEPDMVFSTFISLLILLMCLFGGLLSWKGPLIGAIILTVLNEYIGMFVAAEMARIIFGLLFVVVILFMPSGIMGRFMTRSRS